MGNITVFDSQVPGMKVSLLQVTEKSIWNLKTISRPGMLSVIYNPSTLGRADPR